MKLKIVISYRNSYGSEKCESRTQETHDITLKIMFIYASKSHWFFLIIVYARFSSTRAMCVIVLMMNALLMSLKQEERIERKNVLTIKLGISRILQPPWVFKGFSSKFTMNNSLTRYLLHSHSSYLYIIFQLTLQLTKLTKLYYSPPSQLTNYIIDLLQCATCNVGIAIGAFKKQD